MASGCILGIAMEWEISSGAYGSVGLLQAQRRRQVHRQVAEIISTRAMTRVAAIGQSSMTRIHCRMTANGAHISRWSTEESLLLVTQFASLVFACSIWRLCRLLAFKSTQAAKELQELSFMGRSMQK